MAKADAALEDWTGLQFGNGWEVKQKYNCAEYRKIYQEATGDFEKKIKNAHYRVKNLNCGVETFMERTVIQRAFDNQTPTMSKCKGCLNSSRIKDGTCYYSEQCRIKPLTKIPERDVKVQVGKTYGNFLVTAIQPSGNYADHQCRATVTCIHCGATQERRFDTLLNCQIACDCFRPHSNGERIVKAYLDDHKISYKSEQIFNDLVSPEGGYMRYDFSVLNKNGEIIAMIEFDGSQHFEEAGSYYNPTGAVQIHDNIKNEYAARNNIPLKRIRFDEVLDTYRLLDEFFISLNEKLIT